MVLLHAMLISCARTPAISQLDNKLRAGRRTLRVEYGVAARRLPGHELGNQQLQLPRLRLDHSGIGCNVLLAADGGSNGFQFRQVTCTSRLSPCNPWERGSLGVEPCVCSYSRSLPQQVVSASGLTVHAQKHPSQDAACDRQGTGADSPYTLSSRSMLNVCMSRFIRSSLTCSNGSLTILRRSCAALPATSPIVAEGSLHLSYSDAI